MGNVGPDLRTIGDRGLTDAHLYQVVYDPRVIFGADSPMAPFGASGMWTPEEIVHVVAYLQTLKGNPPGTPPKVTDDKQWNPFTRDVVRLDFGDARDVTSNAALALTEADAVPLWSKAGPKGQSCAGCHGAIGAPDAERPLGVIKSMVGVGARYPKWYGQYGRMMSIEDLLSIHAPETTGHELPTQGPANMAMSVLIKMQSNGMPYTLDTADANVKAAIARGQELFNRRVGQRGQACANCHTERGGAHKFLGGRFLANIDKDAMMNHPYFRTSQGRLWDARVRFQWCMTPLLTNMLPGDAPEYADLETYIISKQLGQPVNVPRSQSH
jgi:sulfur-oxidizing protein SoxA